MLGRLQQRAEEEEQAGEAGTAAAIKDFRILIGAEPEGDGGQLQ
jgi:hypothetical protein